MKEFSNVTFESGRWPEGWVDEAREATFEKGVLRSGRKTRPSFILPGHGWRKVRVEVTVEPGPASVIEFGNGRAELLVDFGSGLHCVTVHGGATLALNKHPLPAGERARTVVFEFTGGQWRATVDEMEVLAYVDDRQSALAGRMELGFWSDCTVHAIRILGDDPLDAPVYAYPPRASDDFHLEVTVDFPDDMYYAPYTLEMMDELFAEYARWGTRRCHWIYDGKEAYHWWRYFREPGYANYEKTLENFGNDILETAVEAAHRHGIELYGICKPFEMAYMLHTYGEGTEKAEKYGRFSRIGGVIYRCPDFTIKHRELMTRRKPGAFGDAENEVFTRIDLVADDDAPAAFTPGDVRIFVSDDNNTYRTYDGPVVAEEVVEDYPVYEHTGSGGRPTGVTRRSRVMRFSGLEIRENFVALAAPGSAVSFGNTLINLLHVFGEKGEERRITLGIVPRAGQTSYDIGTATRSDSHGLDFCNRGIEFDNIEGSPTACLTGYEGVRKWHPLDARHGFIAFARGKEETSVGFMSPSFTGTRQWWLQWVRDILDAGCDGVEMRVRNHHTHMAWAEFGFEKPLRDAFLDQHGVDIWETDDFDLAAWQRLRGEAYTQFYREARALVDSGGKRMGLHITRTFDTEPGTCQAMAMNFDWRRWIDEGLADSVTMKEVFPRTPLAEEILSHTRPKGVPVIFSPFANNIWRKPGGAQVCAGRIRAAREGGYDGFQYYESCAVMRAHPDGRLELEQPELREVFRREFGGTPERED